MTIGKNPFLTTDLQSSNLYSSFLRDVSSFYRKMTPDFADVAEELVDSDNIRRRAQIFEVSFHKIKVLANKLSDHKGNEYNFAFINKAEKIRAELIKLDAKS